MGFRNERRKQHLEGAKFLDNRKAPARRGQRFTLLSFIVLLACLAVMKALNPELSLKSPLLMVVSVGLACFIMIVIGRRSGKD